jgi:hypothetical protein
MGMLRKRLLLEGVAGSAARHGPHRAPPSSTPARRQARTITFSGRPPLRYDALSIDIGVTPGACGVPGALEHTTPVKPINRWAPGRGGIRLALDALLCQPGMGAQQSRGPEACPARC